VKFYELNTPLFIYNNMCKATIFKNVVIGYSSIYVIHVVMCMRIVSDNRELLQYSICSCTHAMLHKLDLNSELKGTWDRKFINITTNRIGLLFGLIVVLMEEFNMMNFGFEYPKFIIKVHCSYPACAIAVMKPIVIEAAGLCCVRHYGFACIWLVDI